MRRRRPNPVASAGRRQRNRSSSRRRLADGFYGTVGALVLRCSFVALGSELLERCEWIVCVFGAILPCSGARMLRGGDGDEPDPSATRSSDSSGAQSRPGRC